MTRIGGETVNAVNLFVRSPKLVILLRYDPLVPLSLLIEARCDSAMCCVILRAFLPNGVVLGAN